MDPDKIIALDKVLFFNPKVLCFSYFSAKMYVLDTHWKHLGEVLLMGTHSICFCREMRKIFTRYPL